MTGPWELKSLGSVELDTCPDLLHSGPMGTFHYLLLDLRLKLL